VNVWKVVVAALLVVSLSQTAAAAVYKLDAVGQINSILLSNNSVLGPAPDGKMSVGDTFRLQATFDTDQSIIGNLFSADPTTNIYYLLGATVRITAGTYSSSFQPTFLTSASTQLWNDRPIGTSLVDAQSFEFSNYDFTGATPFDIGGGLNFELVSLSAFDFAGSARMSDLISELLPSSEAFASSGLTYSYSSGQNPLAGARPIVIVNTDQLAWTISKVPEPAPIALFGAAIFVVTVARKVGISGRRRLLG
jgi:hypothetical protein